MKAMLLTEYKKLELAEMPTPEIGPTDVLDCAVGAVAREITRNIEPHTGTRAVRVRYELLCGQRWLA